MALSPPRVVGRYALYDEIAAGGMATVHYGRLIGPVGFSRTVAIKRLHAQHAKDPEFVSMFLDEARLAARIHHPNVVQTLDVVPMDDELFLVMDYVQGESLARLIRKSAADEKPIPSGIISAIVCGTLLGLNAAHEATDERAEPLGIVHRDVSPQNILVGADGVPRVLDFGVAKASGRVQTTREGQLKGKIAYMAPEQINLTSVDRRADVYAAGVVLWEALTLRRLYPGENEVGIIAKVLQGVPERPSKFTEVPESVETIVMRALEYEPSKRFQSAKEMAHELEAAVPMASAPRVAEWLEHLVGGQLAVRRESVARIESRSGSGLVPVLREVDSEPTQTLTPSGGRVRSSSQVAAGPDGDLSTISASSAALRAQGPVRASRRAPLLAGAIATLGVAAYVGLGRQHGVQPVVVAAPPSMASSVAASPAAPPAPAPIEVAPESATIPAAEVAKTPVTSRDIRQHPSTKPPAQAPLSSGGSGASGAALMTSTSVSKAAPPCTIKSYMDDSGIKHFTKVCD
jgi:serine/threonine protein kinase